MKARTWYILFHVGLLASDSILPFALLPFALLLLPATAFAGETSDVLSASKALNITHHIIGYLAIAVTVLAYVAAMSEEVIALRKSKLMVVGSARVWFAICIY